MRMMRSEIDRWALRGHSVTEMRRTLSKRTSLFIPFIVSLMGWTVGRSLVHCSNPRQCHPTGWLNTILSSIVGDDLLPFD